MSFGLSLLVHVWAFYRISGGLFNPALTIAFVGAGAIPWHRGITFVFSQLLASIIASFAVQGFLPGDLKVGTEFPGRGYQG